MEAIPLLRQPPAVPDEDVEGRGELVLGDGLDRAPLRGPHRLRVVRHLRRETRGR